MKKTAKILAILMGLAITFLAAGGAAAETIAIADNTWMQPWYQNGPAATNGFPGWTWRSAPIANDPGAWEIKGVDVTWGAGGSLEMKIYSNYPQAGLEGAGQADIALDRNRDGIFETGIKMSGSQTDIGKIYTVASWKTPQELWQGNYIYTGRYADLNTTTPAYVPDTVINQGTNNLGQASVTFGGAPVGSGASFMWDIVFPQAFNADGSWNNFNFTVGSGNCANDFMAGNAIHTPIPASALLFATGLLGLAILARRKKAGSVFAELNVRK